MRKFNSRPLLAGLLIATTWGNALAGLNALTPVITGPISAQDVSANVTAATADSASLKYVWVAATIPGLPAPFFRTPAGAWVPWTGGAAPAPVTSTVADNLSVDLTGGPLNLSVFPGTRFYVGAAQSWSELVSSTDFGLIYTVPGLTSYVGTTNGFVAWANSTFGNFYAAPTGSYAGKGQYQRGTVDPISGADLGQPAGMEMYKGSDGHLYVLDLTVSDTPVPQQVSSESAATVDDTCSLNGTNVSGANTDYLGAEVQADLNNPPNSRYFYRLPGADGVCNTADDVFRMVTPATAASTAPTTVPAMPTTTVRAANGAIGGFVAKVGANLDLFDANYANPVPLAIFGSPIGVATVLPVGTTQGYPSGQLYIIDGNIVYVNYATHNVTGPLFTLPSWTPTNGHVVTAASPTTLYFAVNIPASGSIAATTSLYTMPTDGSAAPTLIGTQPGSTAQLQFPVNGSNLIYSVTTGNSYTVYALPQGSATPLTLLSSTQNGGDFTAAANSVYTTTWTVTTNSAQKLQTRTKTQSVILGVDGSVIRAAQANSAFVSGGEYQTWEAAASAAGIPVANITQTPLVTVFQVSNLTPVSVINPTNGYTYTFDGVSGGTVTAISTATNQTLATLGTLPPSKASALTATVRNSKHLGYLEATNNLSSSSPATRDIYLVNTLGTGTLTRVTGNL